MMAKQKREYGIREGLQAARIAIPALIEIPLHADLQSYVRRNFKRVEEDVYVPIRKTTYDDGTGCLKKLEIGPKHYMKSQKVIMMVGATGAGKTTMINGMFNYILGVDFENRFRVKLIEEKVANPEEGITKGITAYTVYHQHGFKVNNSLTIIDTPGFGDPAGILKDKTIKSMIETFFRTKGPNGIDVLDAVIFVVPSNANKLTPQQKYIFDEVLSLFGKDIKDNIFLFCSWCDNPEREPKAVETLEVARVPYSNKYYKFNLGDLYNMEQTSEFNKRYWKMGAKSFQSFFKYLGLTEAKSLQLTKDVIQKRSELEDALSNIQENIKLEINELQKLNKEEEVLKKHEIEIDRNRNYTYEVDEQFVEVEPLEENMTAINCQICYVSCLRSRYQWKDSLLRQCWLFNKKPIGCCKCPNQCQYNSHRCEKVLYIITTKKVTKTLEGLKREYENALGRKMTMEQIINESTERLDQVREQTLTFLDQAKACINKLNEIALKPESVSTEAYIDLMIEAETDKSGEDQQLRIKMLRQLKEKEKVRRTLIDGREDTLLVSIPERKSSAKTSTRSGRRADIIPEGLLQIDNMTHVVEVIRSDGGHFLGKLRKVFKRK